MIPAFAAFLVAATLQAPAILQSGNYIIHSWTGNERLAQNVLQLIQRYDSLPGMPAAAPAFGKPINIYLAPDHRTFVALTGGRAPEWGAGVADPDAGAIVLKAYGGNNGAYDELPRVLRHELAHIALHRYVAAARVPRWFDEGYAEWSAGELDMQGAWLLRVAFATERAPPLDSLELSWPSFSADARVAYLLAASVVQYLVRESGTRGLSQFLARWHDSHDFEAALASTYGLSIDQLEIHWRRDVKHRYGWLAVATQTSAAFTFMAIGVLALYLIRRRRNRVRLEHLKVTEIPDDPAYWVIDPDEPPRDIEDHGEKND